MIKEGAAEAQVKVREEEEIALDSKIPLDFHFKVEIMQVKNLEMQMHIARVKQTADIMKKKRKHELMTMHTILTNRMAMATNGIQLANLVAPEEDLDLDLEKVVACLKVSPNRRKRKNKKNIDMEDQTHTHSHHPTHLIV